MDTRYKGRGIGIALVRDALLRTRQAARGVGIRTMLAHALNEKAAGFYTRLDFIPSPFDPLMLFPLLSHMELHGGPKGETA